MKTFMALAITLSASLSAVAAPKIVSSFSNGSKVSCVASHNLGHDGLGYTEEQMDVFYRIDDGQKEAQAYFQKVQIGNYAYEGFCGKEVCDLSIRDLRTNVVSNMNAAYAKINQRTAQIQIMNFKEDLTLTLACQLIPKK